MNQFCPLIQKDCIQYQCKFFIHLLGNDPQTSKPIDKFDCAISFLPVLLIEGAQQTRQAGAAIESFRNEMVEGNERTAQILAGSYGKLIGQDDENNDNS